VGGADDGEPGGRRPAVEQHPGEEGTHRRDPDLGAGADRKDRRPQLGRAAVAARREEADEQRTIDDAEQEGAAEQDRPRRGLAGSLAMTRRRPFAHPERAMLASVAVLGCVLLAMSAAVTWPPWRGATAWPNERWA